jgi:hypothetical protein
VQKELERKMGKEKDAQLPWSLDDMIVERNRLTDG